MYLLVSILSTLSAWHGPPRLPLHSFFIPGRGFPTPRRPVISIRYHVSLSSLRAPSAIGKPTCEAERLRSSPAAGWFGAARTNPPERAHGPSRGFCWCHGPFFSPLARNHHHHPPYSDMSHPIVRLCLLCRPFTGADVEPVLRRARSPPASLSSGARRCSARARSGTSRSRSFTS